MGTYAITGVVSNGTGLASDYTVDLTNGTLTVNKYAFSYTIGNDSQTYGTPADLAATWAPPSHGRQRPEPVHRLQQHGRHGHGPRRHLRHHRRGVQRHGPLSDYTVTLTNGTLTVRSRSACWPRRLPARGRWPRCLGLLGVTVGLARGPAGLLIAVLAVLLQVLFCLTLARFVTTGLAGGAALAPRQGLRRLADHPDLRPV